MTNMNRIKSKATTMKVLCICNLDDWEQITYVAKIINVDTQRAAKALEKFDFDEPKAIDFLIKEI